MIIGLVYGMAISVLLTPIIESVNYLLIIQISVFIFGFSGLVFGSAIMASVQGFIYALCLLYGFIVGGLGWAVPATDELFPKRQSGLLFLILGIIVGALSWSL